MPTAVVPLIARRINLGNEFGYTPITKKSPEVVLWAVSFEDESPRGTFTTSSEAYFFAAKLIIDNMENVPACGGFECDCGWYEQELYMNKKLAFEKAGFPMPMPEGHISHEHCCCSECPACACPVELCKHNGAHCGCLGCDEDSVQDCVSGYEQTTREYIEIEQLLQREYFEQALELWNKMWDRLYQNGDKDLDDDGDLRINVFRQVA